MQVIQNYGGVRDLCLIEPKIIVDNRGFFKKVYNISDYLISGINKEFVQDNEVYSRKNVLRGFHVNFAHPQAKLIHVCWGEIYDVVIDLRKDSHTYKKWVGITLSEKNHRELYIPEGCAHGYFALKDSYIHFKVTTYYIPNDEVSFAWNSRDFDIKWPVDDPILNEKDKASVDFSKLEI